MLNPRDFKKVYKETVSTVSPHTLDQASYKSVSQQQQREKTTILDMSSHDNDDQNVPDAVEEAKTATNTPEAGEQTPEDTTHTTEYITDNEAAEAAATEENWQQPKVSDISLKITSSLSSIKHRLFSCFSNIFNDQSSSFASAYNNEYDRQPYHKTTTATTIINQQSTKYNCENDLSILLGEDYDDVIGNALRNLQTDNTKYDYSIYGDDNDKDTTLLFNIPHDHESIV